MGNEEVRPRAEENEHDIEKNRIVEAVSKKSGPVEVITGADKKISVIPAGAQHAKG